RHERKGRIPHKDIGEWPPLLCPWDGSVRRYVQSAVSEALSKCGVSEAPTVTGPSEVPNIHYLEEVVCINHSQENQRIGGLIIKKEGPRIAWTLDDHVLPINGPETVWKVPPLLELCSNGPPVLSFGNWHGVLHQGGPYGSSNLPDNARHG